MIKDAKQAKEIVLNVVNKIGILADVSKILADHGVNIAAVAGYALDDKTAKIMLVAEDALRAADALKKGGYKAVKENEVILIQLENKPGALKHITQKLAAEQIDIKQVYGTTCPGNCPATIVISTSDNEKALVAFKK